MAYNTLLDSDEKLEVVTLLSLAFFNLLDMVLEEKHQLERLQSLDESGHVRDGILEPL